MENISEILSKLEEIGFEGTIEDGAGWEPDFILFRKSYGKFDVIVSNEDENRKLSETALFACVEFNEYIFNEKDLIDAADALKTINEFIANLIK